MKRICILCLLAALLLAACGLADAPYMEPVRTYCAALQDDDFTRLQEAIPPRRAQCGRLRCRGAGQCARFVRQGQQQRL